MSLGPTSRNLVAAARHGLDPSPDVAARVRAKVALAVGAVRPPRSTTPRAASVAPKAAAIGAGKVVAIIAIVGALATVAWFVHARHRSVAPAIVVPAANDIDSPDELHVTASVRDNAVAVAPTVRATRPHSAAGRDREGSATGAPQSSPFRRSHSHARSR